jgi:hypothetical protein
MWVSVGSAASYRISYSYNGINWTGVTGSNSIFSDQGNGVAWNGQMWVAVGQTTGTGYTIAYSYDGITNWTGITGSTAIFSQRGLRVAWNGTMWVAVGIGTNSIAYSYNGLNWTGVTGSTSIINNGYSVAFNNKRPNTITFPTNSLNGNVTIPSSIVLNSGDQLDVVCDSYYNTGFTNCSIFINSI